MQLSLNDFNSMKNVNYNRNFLADEDLNFTIVLKIQKSLLIPLAMKNCDFIKDNL